MVKVWRLQQRALSQYLLWLVFVFFFLRICFSGYFWPKCLGIWVRLARHSLELLSLITWRSSRPAEHKLCSAFRNSGMSNRNLFMNLYFSPFSLNLFGFKTITVSQNSWWQKIPKLQNQISLRVWNTKFGLKKTASPLHIKMAHIMADESEQKSLWNLFQADLSCPQTRFNLPKDHLHVDLRQGDTDWRTIGRALPSSNCLHLLAHSTSAPHCRPQTRRQGLAHSDPIFLR